MAKFLGFLIFRLKSFVAFKQTVLHKFVSDNGKIIKKEDAQVPAASSAAFYGRGVFTTLAVYDRKPFLWQPHQHRLISNAARIELSSIPTFANLERALFELISANGVENGRARITLFDVGGGSPWSFSAERKTAFLITTAERREIGEELNLTVSPFRLNSASPLAGVKSCNYLENLLALENAAAGGCGEAVRFNERGEITSACLANLFWTQNERIFTPPLAAGALAGTTRSFVFELAKNTKIEIKETIAGIAALETADEIFLTSAGIGIRSVKKFGDKIYRNRIGEKLRKAFSDIVKK